MASRKMLVGILILVSLTGCATAPTHPRKVVRKRVSAPTSADRIATSRASTVRTEALKVRHPRPAQEIAQADADAAAASGNKMESKVATTIVGPAAATAPAAETPEALPPSQERIPMDMNAHVQKWIQYFAVKDRDRFARFLERGNTYREVVENTLRENELPMELYYLAMIESGYTTSATSHAAAVGVWQFIPGTGTRYGLEINHYVDERRDPIRATEAAAKYLKDLYNVFGSWHLAMAAYNAGEYRIVRAVLNGKSRDFWQLVQQKNLPAETSDYVPKFLAAVEIGENPEKYGFKDIPMVKYPDLEAVEVPSPVRLAEISMEGKIPFDELKRVNPHLLKGYTSPASSTYEVWVPSSHAKYAANVGKKLSRINLGRQTRTLARSVPSAAQKNYYVVARGDTLTSIAAKHKVSTSYLRKLNGLRGSNISVGSRLRVTTKSYHANRSVKIHRVRRGENLNLIADRFGMSLSMLKRMNGLRKNQIYVGQALKVKASGG